MPSQLIISGETGGTPPYQFYVCDQYMCPFDTFFILTETGLIITTESGDSLVWI